MQVVSFLFHRQNHSQSHCLQELWDVLAASGFVLPHYQDLTRSPLGKPILPTPIKRAKRQAQATYIGNSSQPSDSRKVEAIIQEHYQAVQNAMHQAYKEQDFDPVLAHHGQYHGHYSEQMVEPEVALPDSNTKHPLCKFVPYPTYQTKRFQHLPQIPEDAEYLVDFNLANCRDYLLVSFLFSKGDNQHHPISIGVDVETLDKFPVRAKVFENRILDARDFQLSLLFDSKNKTAPLDKDVAKKSHYQAWIWTCREALVKTVASSVFNSRKVRYTSDNEYNVTQLLEYVRANALDPYTVKLMSSIYNHKLLTHDYAKQIGLLENFYYNGPNEPCYLAIAVLTSEEHNWVRLPKLEHRLFVCYFGELRAMERLSEVYALSDENNEVSLNTAQRTNQAELNAEADNQAQAIQAQADQTQTNQGETNQTQLSQAQLSQAQLKQGQASQVLAEQADKNITEGHPTEANQAQSDQSQPQVASNLQDESASAQSEQQAQELDSQGLQPGQQSAQRQSASLQPGQQSYSNEDFESLMPLHREPTAAEVLDDAHANYHLTAFREVDLDHQKMLKARFPYKTIENHNMRNEIVLIKRSPLILG